MVGCSAFTLTKRTSFPGTPVGIQSGAFFSPELIHKVQIHNSRRIQFPIFPWQMCSDVNRVLTAYTYASQLSSSHLWLRARGVVCVANKC